MTLWNLFSEISYIRIDNKLNWRAHIDDIVLKLIKASGMLYQVRDFVNTRILKVIYLVLFESHVHYTCIIWGQNICTINCQKKALRLILFKERNSHTAPLFFKSKMVTLPDKIKSENCLFIRKYVNNKLPPIFNSWFIFSSTFHIYEIPFATKGHPKIPSFTTSTYGKGVFISTATKTWNDIQSTIKDPMIYTFSPDKLKIILFDFFCFFWDIGIDNIDNISSGCSFLFLFLFFFILQWLQRVFRCSIITWLSQNSACIHFLKSKTGTYPLNIQ